MAKPKREAAPPPSKWIAHSRAEVAQFLDVGERQVAEYLARGCPRIEGKRKSYALDQIVQWLRTHVWTARAPTQPPGDDRLDREKLECERLWLENQRKLLRLRNESGELVSRAAAKAEVEQLFHAIRARLDAIPDEIAPSLPADLQAQVASDWKAKLRLVEKEIENWAGLDAPG